MTASLVERTLDTSRKAFMRSWGSPEAAHRVRNIEMRNYRYLRLWEMYDGTAFNSMKAWEQYKATYGLYRQIRQVWDHVHELVEFYATHIWSGSLAKDGKNLPDGVLNAIPLAEDIDVKLAAAIAQLWTWWNFQQQMTVIPRYCAALGELLVEIHDDPQRGKILIELVWPGFIKDIHLDESGNVTYYCIQYTYFDRNDGRTYTYRRDVDREYFTTYRDDEPYNYERNPIPAGADPDGTIAGLGMGVDIDYPISEQDDGHKIENPYGFVPAVWFRHHRVMGVRGEPAIWSTQAQVDEINSLFSHLLDKAHVSLEAPIVVAGNINPRRFQHAMNQMFGAVKRTFTADLEDERADAETLNILEGPAGTSISTIELKISEAGEAVDRIVKAIEKKCPEVTFYSELRSMTQLTGPGASRLLGDVDRKVKMVAGGYDHELIKLMQMGVAIAGWRLSEGADGWEEQTTAQQKFAGFDLQSYAKGDLDFDIMPRDLVPMTTKDRYEVLQMKKLVLPFLPPEQLAKEGGYAPELAKQWADQFEKDQEAKAQRQMELTQKAPFGRGISTKENGNGKITEIKRPTGAPEGGPQRGQPVQNRRRDNG